MTLRELWQKTIDLFNNAVSWFSDGLQKIVSGNLLDLTIGQAVTILFLSCYFINSIFSRSEDDKWFDLNMNKAKQGDTIAQMNLGGMYSKHGIFNQDDEEVYKWFYIAETNGHITAKESREFVEKNLSPRQITRAQKSAKKWMEEHKPS